MAKSCLSIIVPIFLVAYNFDVGFFMWIQATSDQDQGSTWSLVEQNRVSPFTFYRLSRKRARNTSTPDLLVLHQSGFPPRWLLLGAGRPKRKWNERHIWAIWFRCFMSCKTTDAPTATGQAILGRTGCSTHLAGTPWRRYSQSFRPGSEGYKRIGGSYRSSLSCGPAVLHNRGRAVWASCIFPAV